MRAICYARLSMQGEDVTSITRQVDQCTAEAKRRNREPVVFVEGEGHHSGNSDHGRPEFQAAMQLLDTAKDVDMFVVADSSRAWRNAQRYLEFREHLEAKGIEYVSLMEPHLNADMPRSSKRFITGISAAAMQYYRDFISDKMLTHTRYVKESGGTWGNPPCGLKPVNKGITRRYEKSDETYELNGETKTYLETVEAMLRLYVSSEIGGYELTRQMSAYRWKGHDGNPRPVSPAHFSHFKDHAQYYRGILDDDLLNRYLEKLARRAGRKENGRALRRDPPALWGLVFCPSCGGRFVIKHSDNVHAKWTYYKHTQFKPCPNYHYAQADKLDGLAYAHLAKFLDLPLAEKRKLIAKATTTRPDRTHLKRERIEAKLANLKLMRVEGELSPKEYHTWKAKLESELAALPTGAVIAVSAAEMERRLSSPVQTIRDAAPIDRNQAMRGLFKRVLVWKNGRVKFEMQDWVGGMFGGR